MVIIWKHLLFSWSPLHGARLGNGASSSIAWCNDNTLSFVRVCKQKSLLSETHHTMHGAHFLFPCSIPTSFQERSWVISPEEGIHTKKQSKARQNKSVTFPRQHTKVRRGEQQDIPVNYKIWVCVWRHWPCFHCLKSVPNYFWVHVPSRFKEKLEF